MMSNSWCGTRISPGDRHLGQARRSTVEAVITEIVATSLSEAVADRWLGMFAEEPELLDQNENGVCLALDNRRGKTASVRYG